MPFSPANDLVPLHEGPCLRSFPAYRARAALRLHPEFYTDDESMTPNIISN